MNRQNLRNSFADPVFLNSMSRRRHVSLLFCVILGSFLQPGTVILSAPAVGPWIPIFQGVDHSVSTNLSASTEFPNRHVVHALRVDLKDPDIRLLTTPRNANYISSVREVGALTVSDFLRTNRLQAAINANFFDTGAYYLPPGYPMDVYGLSVSEGIVVSAQESLAHAAAIIFDRSNQPTVIPRNWPATSVEGVHTAVAGDAVLVRSGINIAPRSGRFDSNPRTVFGVSEDKRFLYLIAIDGRQPGYSIGASDYESAGWLLLLGAYDGINMDGGGSTTLVMQNSLGEPVRLNRSSAVADSGRERTVGSHLGIYAKPLKGFINDVAARPDDTTASVSWTTTSPATGELHYGTTSALGSRTMPQAGLSTQHHVILDELSPGTRYYYRVVSVAGDETFTSPMFRFSTENHVTTNQLFDIGHAWRHTTEDLDGVPWTELDYDDSAWEGPAPALLWVDLRASGPNAQVQPKATRLEASPANNGYPFVTYSFRTRFSLPRIVPGASLHFTAYVDDGAVFYLNGVEVYRLRMPAVSSNATLATGFGCDGDATCLDQFTVPLASLTSAVVGENCLAVEVHNYHLRSADMTFGMGLSLREPEEGGTKLEINIASGGVQLSWKGSGFMLQSAITPMGPWRSVQGSEANSIFLQSRSSAQFYRLAK